MEKYGYFSSRCYHIADKDECWAVQLTRGKRLAAKRVPDGHVYFIPNHYTIHALEPSDKKNFYYTPDLVEFAVENGWYTPAVPGDYSDFDFAKAYQEADRPYNMARARNGWGILGFEEEWAQCVAAGSWRPFSFKAHRKYTIDDCKALMRSHYEGRPDFMTDWQAYTDQFVTADAPDGGCREAAPEVLARRQTVSEVSLNRSEPLYPRDPHQALDDPYTICCGSTVESTVVDFAEDPAATCVYRAWRKPCTNPYVPLFLGSLKVPESYAWMDRAEAETTHFAPPDGEFVYDPETAFWQYENLIWLTELDYGHAHGYLAPQIAKIETVWQEEVGAARAQYEEMKKEDPQLAKSYLSEFSDGKARYALHWVRRMTQRIGRSMYRRNQGVPEE